MIGRDPSPRLIRINAGPRMNVRDNDTKWELIWRMVDKWQALRWAKALLILAVAIALLVVPLASVQAMPCRDHAGSEHNERMTVAESPQAGVASGHDGLQGNPQIVDHKACSGSACGFCIVVMDTANGPDLNHPAVSRHYARRDQVVRGLVLPPALGPPRFQV